MMDQIRQILTDEQAILPIAAAMSHDQLEKDIVLLMVRREQAKRQFEQRRAESRRAASRRGRQFERRALATTPRW
jgi:hypothetical protein